MESAEHNFLVLSRCKDLMSFTGIHHSEIKAILKTCRGKPQIDILM